MSDDLPPPNTAHGALLAHITGGHVAAIDAGPRSFQPMNINFGLFPPLDTSPERRRDGERLRGAARGMAKRRALTSRALADLKAWAGGALAEPARTAPSPEAVPSPEPHAR